MSPLQYQRNGFNKLLEDIYGKPILITNILKTRGFAESEIALLRKHIKVFIHQLIQNWREYFEVDPQLGPIRIQIIYSRYELSGKLAPSLAQIGEQHNLSRQRISQLQKNAIWRLSRKPRIKKLEALICQTAAEILHP